MTKEEIYLDLSKLSEKQQDEIIGMLPAQLTNVQYKIDSEYNSLIYSKRLRYWIVGSHPFFRTEVTHEEFKTLINE